MHTQSSKQSSIKANQAQLALKAAERTRCEVVAKQALPADKRAGKKAQTYDFVGIAG